MATSIVKIVFKDDIRRLTLPGTAPFDSLIEELKKIYPGIVSPSGINFRYRDDEDDLVTVTSNMELTEAIETCKGTLKLRVSEVGEKKNRDGLKGGEDAAPSESDGEFVKVSKDGQRTANIISKESKELKEAELREAKKEAEKEAEIARAAEKAEKKAAKAKKLAEKRAEQAKRLAEKAAKEAAKAQKLAEKEAAMVAKEAAKAKKLAEKKESEKKLLANLGAEFVKDLTIPDGMEVEVSSKVVKTWLIKNSGVVAWPKGVQFGVLSKKGIEQIVEDAVVPLIKPGQDAAISVHLTVAPKPGKFKTANYSLVYNGKPFGDYYYAVVRAVKAAKKLPVWPVRKSAPVEEKEAKHAAPQDEKTPNKSMPAPAAKYGAHFLKDLTVKDDSVIAPGQAIVKKWLVKNTGEVAWPKGTYLVSLPGSTFGKDLKVEVKGVEKDSNFELVLNLVAPLATGKHTARFQLALPNGEKFGHKYWVNIVVSKFPNRDQLKSMFMDFLADPKIVAVLQENVPDIIKEIRQGKKLSSIVEKLVKGNAFLSEHQFIIFIQPFLASAENFLNMQVDALIGMYSLLSMTPFSAGAAVKPEKKAAPKENKKSAPMKEDKKSAPMKEAKKAAPIEVEAVPAYPYNKELKQFKSMGFKNLDVIKTLLQKYKGDVQAVTNELFRS